MANLGTFTIDGNDYITVESATGLTLLAGTKYLLQSYNNDFFIRTGTEGKGVHVRAGEKVEYTDNSEDLYVKPIFAPIELNILEQTGGN